MNAYNIGTTSAKIKSQGIYASHTKDLLIEENFMDRNGWYQGRGDTQPNQYNHNIYLSSDNAGPCIVRGNVISQGAAHGLQLRSGGTAEKNAFIGNAVGMNIGYSNKPVYYSGATVVRDNVFTDGRPQIPNDFTSPQTGAIWGLWKQKIDNVTVRHNIVANIQDTRGGNMKPYNEGFQGNPDAFGPGNIAWNWKEGNFPTPAPNWKDASRDKDKFAKAQGYNDYQTWVNAACRRGIKSWPTKFTAYDYINYIRNGFDKSSVSPPSYNRNARQVAQPKSLRAAEAAPQSFRVYPNPASAQLTVEGIGDYRLELYDLTGRMVLQHDRLQGISQLDIGHVRPGLHIIKLRRGEQPELRWRVIIE